MTKRSAEFCNIIKIKVKAIACNCFSELCSNYELTNISKRVSLSSKLGLSLMFVYILCFA